LRLDAEGRHDDEEPRPTAARDGEASWIGALPQKSLPLTASARPALHSLARPRQRLGLSGLELAGQGPPRSSVALHPGQRTRVGRDPARCDRPPGRRARLTCPGSRKILRRCEGWKPVRIRADAPLWSARSGA